MKLTRLLVMMGIIAASATGAYHFVRYSNLLGYQQPIYDRFDLNALVNKTVPFFVVSDGAERLAPGDNSNALISQILLAAKTWSDVSTSDLRLAFGGYAPAASGPQGAPGIDVMFSEDVPPGVISYAGPTVKAEANLNASAPFSPILRSLVVFRKDLANVDGVAYPSYSEAFFLNAVHELGHALGLQHTFASSAMATQLTRSTTKAKPLAADDVAALSILYPSRNFAALFAEIRGRVTQGEGGVNLASVIAISLNGTAVSTLTNPDGTYRIQGVPPGPYQIYVHPIPPAVRGQATPGDIIPPRDPDNNPIPVNNFFELQFYPGTRDLQAAQTLNLSAAQVLTGIDFQVSTRNAPPSLFAPTTYSYVTNPSTGGGTYVRPAFITPQVVNPGFIASGYGFVTGDSRPVAGLKSSILGGSPAINGIRGFSNQFIIFDLFLSSFATDGERHMLLDNGNETYVLPAAIQVASRRAPEILNVNWIEPAADGSLQAEVTANGISSRTRVLIDGEPATVQSFNEAVGVLRVTVPPAPTGHVARVVLLNADGQSTLFLRPDAPAQLPFTSTPASGFSITPQVLSAGIETVVEVISPGARFAPGQVTLGFGSADIQVRGVSVLGPDRLLASVVTSAQAAAGGYLATLRNGLHHLKLENSVIIQQLSTAMGRLKLQPDSRWTTESGSRFVLPGSNALVKVAGLESEPVTATLNGSLVQVLGAGAGRVTLQVPATIPAGWAVLRLTVDGEAAHPVLVSVAGASPTIQSIWGSDQFQIDTNRPARGGDTVAVTFKLDADLNLRANDIAFTLGETPIYTLRVERLGPGIYQTLIALPSALENGNYPLAISVRDRESSPVSLPYRAR